MASSESSSPSMFLGQAWSAWADKVTNEEDEDAESDEKRDETSDEMESDITRDKEDPQVMRLKYEDSKIFGLCPARDEFYLVVCEQCKQVVKPQALQTHIEFRHGKPPDGPLPPLPILAPLGDPSSPACNKQIMRTHRKTERSIPRPPSRANSHPLILAYPEVAQSPSREQQTKRTQSVPDLITAVEPSIDISPNGQLEHLRQLHSTSPPEPHEPHILLGSPQPPPLHDVLSAAPSPVDTTVLLDSESLSAVSALTASQLTEADLSQELTIQVGLQDESGVDRTLSSLDASSFADTVEVVLASPPIQNMPVPLTAAESLSTALSTPHIISVPVNDSVSQVNLDKLPKEQTNMVCINRAAANSNFSPVQGRPLVAITPTPTPTPPPAPSLTPASTPTPPKSSSKKKKVNAFKSDKNVPCKDRRYDPDKHCGVWSDEHKRHCTRSLTCKTHSLSLRRAVEGRRLSFNELLAEHKARSQALAAAKAAIAAGTSTSSAIATTAAIITTTTTTTTAGSNKHGSAVAATQLTLSQGGGMTVPGAPEMPSPQKLGGTPTVPILQGPGPTPVIINSSAHPLKRPLTVSTQSSIHVHTSEPSPSHGLGASLDTSQNHAPLRRQEHHPSPTHHRTTPQNGDTKGDGDTSEPPCTYHHPRPFAMCTYGFKRTEQGMLVISRRQDRLRAALAGLVERQVKPPPLKKVCYPQESAVKPNLAKNGNHATSVPPKLTNSHLDQGVHHSMVPNSKSSKSNASSSKNKKSKSSKAERNNDGSASQPTKNAKIRRKSGSGGSGGVTPAIVQSSTTGNLVHNIFAVSSNSQVPLALAPTTYTVVGGNGLQPVDVINVDPNTSVGEMQGQLLKNLRFVVTNIETNANNATSSGSGTSQPTMANVTLPIINAVGSTPMVIGNIGALQLHDGKMNIKSRTKSTSNKAMDRQASRTRKPSGSTVTHCTNQQSVQIGTVQGDTIIVQDQGVIPSMRSSPSPVLRPESPSSQLTSIPNGIIPSPSGTSLYTGTKVYGGNTSGNAVVGVGASGGLVVVDQPHHHQQQHQNQHQHQHQADMTSPSGNSTPSPGQGGNSTETSPSGGFQYSSGIQSLSASKSSNSSKSSSGSSSRKQANLKGSGGALSGGVAHSNQHGATTVQQIPLQVPVQLPQHIMANLIDAQGKPLSAIIPANHPLFSNIQIQQGGGGAAATAAATPGVPVIQGAVATVTPGDHQNKASSPPTAAAAASILAQQPIALSLQQTTPHHQHHQTGSQAIRLQGSAVAAVGSVGEHPAQVVLSPSGTAGDPRQELKLHH